MRQRIIHSSVFDDDHDDDYDDELPLLPLRARLAAAEENDRKRARTSAAKPGRIQSTSASAPPVPPPGSAAAAAGVVVVAVEDTDALDCGVCYLPLKPPIFQVNPPPRARACQCLRRAV
jgi:E3 ubiquitin-protein ligase SIAH1